MQPLLFVALLALALGAIVWMRLSARRATPEETRRVLAERAGWIAANRLGLGLALGGGGIAVTGLAMSAHATLGQTVVVDLAGLEAGEPSDATFVRVHGHGRPELATCRETHGARTCRTPFTSSPAGRTIALLVSSSEPLAGERDEAGMVSSAPAWGEDEVVARGLRVTPHVLVLLRGERPEERRPMGVAIFACGAALAVAGGVMIRRGRRARR